MSCKDMKSCVDCGDEFKRIIMVQEFDLKTEEYQLIWRCSDCHSAWILVNCTPRKPPK